MIDKPLDKLDLETIGQPLSDTAHMLDNDERLRSDVTPLQRLRNIDEDTYEELVCVWAFSCLMYKGYKEVYRVGQSGDKGRDVLAYYDRANGIYDLFQCKRYDSALVYSQLRGEIGKLIVYTYTNTYPLPQSYYLVCPNDVSQSFIDLLADKGQQLKAKIKEDWNDEIKKKVGKNWIKMDEVLERYIDGFDFDVIKKIEPLRFINEIKESPYYFYYFGGGFNMIKVEKLSVPETPRISERTYIQHLNDAYSEDCGHEVDALITDDKYNRHLLRARTSFYEAEEVKIASRKSTSPDADEFESLKEAVLRHIGNELDEDYPNGFNKVKAIETKASIYHAPESMLIAHLIGSNTCVGVCHHLSNEDKIQWKVK